MRVLAAVALTLLLAGCGDDAPLIERAQRLVESDHRFGTADEAAESFVDVAELLLDAGLLESSAFVQMVAVDVLGCTQPGVHDARRVVLDHLQEVERAIERREPRPPLPALPECE